MPVLVVNTIRHQAASPQSSRPHPAQLIPIGLSIIHLDDHMSMAKLKYFVLTTLVSFSRLVFELFSNLHSFHHSSEAVL